MAEYQVELGFSIVGRERDVDLLELFGQEFEEIAGVTGPATFIQGERYMAALTVDASSPIEAGKLAAYLFVEAMNAALRATGDELDEESLWGRYQHYFAQVDHETVLA